MMDHAESILQFGELGVLGIGFLMIVRHMLTQADKTVNALERSIKSLTLVVLDMHGTLIRHDAQVRGVNPAVGDTDNERFDMAKNEYDAILRAIDNTAEAIRRSLERPDVEMTIKR